MVDDEQEFLKSLFGTLLAGYGAAASRCNASPRSRADSFRSLLEGFIAAHKRSLAAEAQEAAKELRTFEHLFGEYAFALKSWRECQENIADDFSILDVLRVTSDELRHSMTLAWLLDHDLTRYGTHAQGSLGFHLMLEALGLPKQYADSPYWVRREVSGDKARIDLEIAARARFLIWIENKIWSGEGEDQTNREWSDLLRRAQALGVPAEAAHAFFLTIEGTRPANPHFAPISWRRIANVFDCFAAKAKPLDVKLFCSHYARALSKLFAAPTPEEEVQHDEGIVQRGGAVPRPPLA